MPSSKKRPGVEAAIRLASSKDVGLWERVELQYDSVRSQALVEAEKNCSSPTSFQEDHDLLTKDQLLDIVGWKFAVGKPRYPLLGLLRSNTDASVQKCSKDAIRKANELQATECCDNTTGELTTHGKRAVKEAMEELTRLKGVGLATATALLCRCQPSLFCYMYDEVIDSFEPKRDYTMAVYLRINSHCLQLAQTLGDGWTTHRVATVLWTAARVLAQNGEEDLTTSITGACKKKGKSNPKKEEAEARTSSRKRRRTKR